VAFVPDMSQPRRGGAITTLSQFGDRPKTRT